MDKRPNQGVFITALDQILDRKRANPLMCSLFSRCICKAFPREQGVLDVLDAAFLCYPLRLAF